MNKLKWSRLFLGCGVFGALIGIRGEFSQIWLRAGIAAVAAVVLVVTAGWAQRAH